MKLNLNYLKYTNSIDELKDIDVKYGSSYNRINNR